MRDGMPGPGWWIASDGQWYPPELHPDVRVPAAVAVEDPVVPRATAFDASPALPAANGAAVATAAYIEAKNGTATRTPLAPTDFEQAVRELRAPKVRSPEVKARGHKPDRSKWQRRAPAMALGLGTLVVIIALARGHDVRPSLNSATATTVPADPTTSTVTSAQRVAATAAVTTPASGVATSAAGATATSPTTTRSGTTTSTTAAKIAPKVVSVFDLVKGNCVDGAGLTDGLVTTVRVVDCSEVHTHEVYYSARYPEATFDATKISNYANDTCLAQFATYVGIDYARSRYQYLHIVPTQESWTRDNDRDIVCVAFEENATITGSIAGRAQ